ncbi:MAG: TetR/AcrR family transcriptional regulator [Myxococcota bacterium]
MTSPSPTRVRRTQAERRASTRGRLLAATIACLAESGATGATTALIEARAGVSRGARIHHYPTKANLLAAAVEHYYRTVALRYADAIREMGPRGQAFSSGFDLLWKTWLDPTTSALLEIFVAARTDPELQSALRNVVSQQHRETRLQANELFPDLATREADGLLECLQATMLGLSLRRMVFGETQSEGKALDLMERMVDESFLRPRRAQPEIPNDD